MVLAAHAKGTAHKYTPSEAAEAGRKGGLARARNIAAVANRTLVNEVDKYKQELSNREVQMHPFTPQSPVRK